MTMTNSASTTTASCWICLDEGADDHGESLVRNCACRGDAGWAHVACLSAYAKVQSDGMSTDDWNDCVDDSGKDTAWSQCQNCKQEHLGDLRMTLANNWLDAVSKLDNNCPQRIAAMLNLAHSSTKIGAYDVTIQTCEDVRRIMTSNMRDFTTSNSLSVFFCQVEKSCLAMLTAVCMQCGNEEKGAEYAEKWKAWGRRTKLEDEDAMEDLISVLKGPAPGQDSRGKTQLDIFADMYKSAVEVGGKDSPNAIKAAACVAQAMVEAKKYKESYSW